jgi:hypothetical protein
MIGGSAMVLVSHLIITLVPQAVPMCANIALALLGIGYSLVRYATSPSVHKIIPDKNLGTAYSLIYWVQNLGMWAVPIYVGRIFKKEISEAGNISQEITAAIHAEYVFIFLGIVAIATAMMLYHSSRRHPELRLDEPAQ